MIDEPSPNCKIDNIAIRQFALTEEDAKVLYDYLMNRAGYISYEYDLVVLSLIKKLGRYLEGEK